MQGAVGGVAVEQRDDLVTDERDHLVRFGCRRFFGARSYGVEQLRRRGHTNVGQQERFFELVPGVGVDLAAAHAAERARERAARAPQAVA